jgi:hypothetical protein
LLQCADHHPSYEETRWLGWRARRPERLRTLWANSVESNAGSPLTHIINRGDKSVTTSPLGTAFITGASTGIGAAYPIA